jgi:hypothetical protein
MSRVIEDERLFDKSIYAIGTTRYVIGNLQWWHKLGPLVSLLLDLALGCERISHWLGFTGCAHPGTCSCSYPSRK